MSTTTTLGMLALGLLLAAGCGRSSSVPSDDPQPTAGSAPATPAPELDPRTPLPLTAMMAAHQKEQMRDHLRVVQEIVGALATDDFDKAAASAERIAFSGQAAMMCQHMGAGAPGFTELGVDFHRTADGIAAAAERHDRAAVAASLDATLQKCIGCHATYRQEIVADLSAPIDGR